MKRTTNWLRLTTSLALVAALALPMAARADENGENNDKGDKQEQAQDQKDEIRQLKAFDLKHRKPQEIQQILTLRKQAGAPRASGQRVAAGQVRTTFYRGNQKQLVIAFDAEKNVLFVRGLEDELKEIEELVNSLDVPAEELKTHTIGDMRLIPISKENASQVQSTLTQLQLKSQVTPMGDISLVVVCNDGSEEQETNAKQIETVISKLTGKKDRGEGQGQDAKSQDAKSQDAENQDANKDRNADKNDSQKQDDSENGENS